MSLCGKIKRRRRLLSFPDDRTKLTDPSEWLQYNLAPPTSPAVFKTARVRLFATHSHHPLVVSICHHLAKIIVLYLPRPLGYDCNDFGTFSSHIVHELMLAHTCAHTCNIVAYMALYAIVWRIFFFIFLHSSFLAIV